MTTPSPPDWRGLCRQLASYLQGRKDREIGWPGEDPEQDLLDHVHALLAQPEPEDDVALLRAALEATAAQRRAEDDARIASAQSEPILCPRVTKPRVLRPTDRYELGELFRSSWLKHGSDSWCSIADDVIAALAQPEPEVVGPTPSEQLVEQWVAEVWHEGTPVRVAASDLHLAARAADWGARWGRPAPAPAEGGMATDDNDENWQWYTYCPEEGIELYPNRQQAKSAAQSIMGSYEVAAHSDGWHEDMELVSWGMLVPVEHAQVVARGPADPGGEFDEWVRYELRASRPAPAPAGEVQP